MKYMKQFAIILLITFIGELLKYITPLPIPGSIYGLLFMLFALLTKIIKLEEVKETSDFLVEIMPLMFIPVAANLINLGDKIMPVIIPLLIIIPITTLIVMILTGKLTDFILNLNDKGELNE